MALFLLIPGAWHGAWCWATLTPLLQNKGHKVIAPDLAAIPPGANPLTIWTQQLIELVQQSPEPLILLGHSRGGMIASEVAARAPNCVRGVVYLSAFLLTDGETMQSAMARPEAGGEVDYLRPARGRCLSVAPDAVIPLFYNMTAPQPAQDAAAQLHPEPVGTFSAPSTISRTQIETIPKVYIECSEDNAISLALQRAMQAAIPCPSILTLTSDHSPFISQPEQLATLLNSTAQALEPPI